MLGKRAHLGDSLASRGEHEMDWRPFVLVVVEHSCEASCLDQWAGHVNRHLRQAEAGSRQRFRAFELLQQTIRSDEALRIGMVTEVLPADRLMARAQEIAADLLQLPPLARRYTRLMFTRRLKRPVNDELPFDMGLEGHTVAQALRGKMRA